ncbi:MAG: alpha-amylase, partial [Vibrio sp.]|nr:alpha-amylase [Vibrio sp.]
MTNVQPTDVILHAFDWPYRLVAERAEQIFQLGYKTVLISPPMKSFKTAQGTKWWQRYQPQDYRIIDNQLGNTHDFKQMVETLTALGLRI